MGKGQGHLVELPPRGGPHPRGAPHGRRRHRLRGWVHGE